MANPHPHAQAPEVAPPVASNGDGRRLLTAASDPVALDDVDVNVGSLTPVLVRRMLQLQTEGTFSVVDLTDRCQELLEEVRMDQGHLVVFSPHTTCAVKINERESCFFEDLRAFMESLVPSNAYYRHDDFLIRDPETMAGVADDEPLNGHSHIKQMLLGAASETVPVIDGELALGQWQRVLFIELDQSRPRKVRLHAQGWA